MLSNNHAHKITNIPLLRKNNVLTLFNTIWEKKVITRKEIASLTTLTAPPISNVINQFLKKGFVKIKGKGSSDGGRQPDLIEFVPDSYYVIGLSIGVYRHRAVICDLYGKKVREVSSEAHYTGDMRQLPDQLDGLVRSLINGFPWAKKLIGIGISFPGSVDSNTGVVLNSPIIGNAAGLNIKAALEERFNIPLFTENNANLCALNEYWFGKGRGKEFVLFIYAGYGIGSGLVIRGEIYTGSKAAAGEIGHTVMVVNGKKCYCGSYGCLETIASIPALYERYFKMVEARKTSYKKHFSIGETEKIFDGALKGDRIAMQIITDFGRYIGIATANLLNILNPSIVIFGGEYLRVKNIILSAVVNAVQERAWPVVKNTEIVFTDYGMEAESQGAATLVIKKLLETGYAYLMS